MKDRSSRPGRLSKDKESLAIEPDSLMGARAAEL